MVRKEGLEPSWVSPPDPKSGASANSATFALRSNLSPLITLITDAPDEATMARNLCRLWLDERFQSGVSCARTPALNASNH